MKVIIVGTAYPYRGGIAAFNERVAQAYLAAGDEVEICTFTLQYPSFLFPGKTQFSEIEAPENLSIERKVNSINPFNWIAVGNEIAKKAPDLLIISFWTPFIAPCFGTIAKRVKKNHKTKIVALLHNLIPHENQIGQQFLLRYLVHNMDGFITMSKAVLKELSQFDTQKKRAFSPHPIYDHFGIRLPKNETLAQLNLSQEPHYLLFFGLIRPYKGLDLLIEAFADPRLRDMNLKLMVVGEFYENEKNYRDQIQELKVEDKILIYNKFIPDNEVNRYFSACDMVVLPYKTATQSGVTQIAFHFNKPMLVTNVGGLAEIVLHDQIGYVVEPEAKEIADAIVDFYQNNRAIAFEKNIEGEKDKYSWKTFREVLNSLF
ncbi:MAG: glycosyltransferase [Bacteroidales bacterium]|jgi:glycosyltransferase involved in cell wall biosynthesis|nr:glycosyltransferase [Bacteroidales bacterium]